MNERHQFGVAALQCWLNGLWLDHASPLSPDWYNVSATALGDLYQQLAEIPTFADDNAVTGLDKRGHGRFQAGATGTGHWKGLSVVGLKSEAAQGHHFAHDGGELRIELAE